MLGPASQRRLSASWEAAGNDLAALGRAIESRLGIMPRVRRTAPAAIRPTDVRCPSGIPAKVGSALDCHFTGPDGPYVAHVRITSVHGEPAIDYIVTRRTS
jgi:hypothetical protein